MILFMSTFSVFDSFHQRGASEARHDFVRELDAAKSVSMANRSAVSWETVDRFASSLAVYGASVVGLCTGGGMTVVEVDLKGAIR